MITFIKQQKSTQFLMRLIKPALQKGNWVVADRFELSSFAYQGGGRGLNSEMIERLSSFALDGFKPDLTLYLDITPELGMERARKRGQFDRIDQQSIDFFHKVHTAYMQRISNDATCFKIDSILPIKEVQQHILVAMKQFLEQQV